MSIGKISAIGLLALMGLLLTLPGLLRSKSRSAGDPLIVYCAAGVKPAVFPLAKEFERQFGQEVQLMYGGSGTLLSNLEVSRTGDLYIAADQSYIDLAAAKGLIAETLPLAWQRPVIAVARGNPKNIRSLDDLMRPNIRLALGNPDAASIGRQTQKLLAQAGIWAQVKNQVEKNGVFKPTVPEVANDVKLGAVDAGIVWDATVAQYPELVAVRVPSFDQAREQISAAVIARSRQPTAALRFARYLNSQAGNAVFARRGFEAIEGDEWNIRPEITFFGALVNRRAVEEVVHAFAEREGVTVHTVFDEGAALIAPIQASGPEKGATEFPDIYLTEDRHDLDQVGGELFQEVVDLSETDIVIAVPKGNPKQIGSTADLAKVGLRIAIADPERCALGFLTRTLLGSTGMQEAIAKNATARASSSAPLVAAVATGSADAAICYLADTISKSHQIEVIHLPSPSARAVQSFAIARSSAHQYLARRLLRQLATSHERFEQAGFRLLPGNSQPAP